MEFLLYGLGMLIGLYMVWGGVTKSDKKPYYWLHRRAELLWRSKAHTFMSFSGGAVVAAMFYFLFFG